MYQAELAFAKRLALQAGDIMRQYNDPELASILKHDGSPVTAADNAINDLILKRVGEEYPEHGVISEEGSRFDGQEYAWVCDPLDGTVAQLAGIPTSMFSGALVKNGIPVVAAAYNPWVDRLYTAVKDGGSYCNDNKIHVSTKALGQQATLLVSGSLNPKKAEQAYAAAQELDGKAYVIAVLGAVFAATQIASGFSEGYIFRYDGAHDMAAAKLIVEEAGGICTDLAGSEQRYDQPINGAIVSNGVIHSDLLKLA